jgi:indolepyruvate ferredoxin oxidoreductase
MGWVPVSREALERAIELNGVAIDFNKKAFLLGRRYAAQPERVEAMLPENAPVAIEEPTLDALIEDRRERLVAYQNAAYAQRYLDQIARVRAADPAPESENSLTRAVAKQLYKLMAYKDEYEVARLHSDPAFRKKLEAQFEGDFELRFHLAPPIISKPDPETGKMKKREFGPWMMQAFKLLAKFKWLRGTRFDVFALTEERKLERADLAQYVEDIETILRNLSHGNYDLAVAIADLPDKLRGYGHVKARNRAEVNVHRAALLRALHGETQFYEIGAKRAA